MSKKAANTNGPGNLIGAGKCWDGAFRKIWHNSEIMHDYFVLIDKMLIPVECDWEYKHSTGKEMEITHVYKIEQKIAVTG